MGWDIKREKKDKNQKREWKGVMEQTETGGGWGRRGGGGEEDGVKRGEGVEEKREDDGGEEDVKLARSKWGGSDNHVKQTEKNGGGWGKRLGARRIISRRRGEGGRSRGYE